MKAELYRQIAEQMELEEKAIAFNVILVLLNNAISYMMEQNMNSEEIADYLGTSTEMLHAIDNEDVEEIVNLN